MRTCQKTGTAILKKPGCTIMKNIIIHVGFAKQRMIGINGNFINLIMLENIKTGAKMEFPYTNNLLKIKEYSKQLI